MPKAAATQIIIHRIEFQETERQMLQDLTTVWSFNRVMDPLVRLINDNTTLLLILSGIAAWLGFTYIPPALEDAYQQITEFQEQLSNAIEQGTIIRERIDLVGTAVTRGPLWGLVDLIEAFTGTNIPDFGTGYEPGESSGGGGGF
ncbi:MAG TPA: hypothetical protein EYN66_24385 [Myxococcales bacterium]|jgi:hypothetical protein|nr:hypothetical protein [Myxococcales bacterium]